MHKVSIPIPNIANSKNSQEFFMKMLNYSMPDNDGSGKKSKEKKNPQSHEEKSTPKKNPVYVDEGHLKAVATGLINLILSMDHSSSADMLLLSFKVIEKMIFILLKFFNSLQHIILKNFVYW